MYERTELTSRCSYLESTARIGLIRCGDGACVAVDGGDGPAAAQALLDRLKESGERLTAVFNTHTHADHVGGNAMLQQATGCAVFVPGAEVAVARTPALNAALLYGGFPGPDQRHPFFLASPSDALPLTDAALPEGMEAIPLPGHSPCMTAYRCDGVLFLGDALCARETLEKCPLSFVWDLAAYRASLRRVMTLEAEWYLPAHAPALREVKELAQFHLDCADAVEERILSLCAEPVGFDALLAALMKSYGLHPGPNRWLLTSSTLRSYLSAMIESGRLKADFSALSPTFVRA